MLCSDVILPSMDLWALLGTQVSLSHASLSIVIPSITERPIAMAQFQVGASRCPAGALPGWGEWWVAADALGESHADGDEAQSPFLSWGSLRATT